MLEVSVILSFIDCFSHSFTGFSNSRENSPSPDAPSQSVSSTHSHIPTSTPAQHLKCNCSSSFSDLSDEPSTKCKGRISGPGAVADVASVMRELASSFTTSAIGPGTPEHCAKAICLAEKDEDLTISQKVNLICMFQKDISMADSYMAITNKELCTAFVQKTIEDN